MIPYLIVFLVTTLLICFSSTKKNARKELFWGIMAVLILSIFTGIRDFSMGTDINYYILRDFEIAKYSTHGIVEYIKNDYNGMEILYLIIQYYCSKIFETAHSVLFIIGIIINTFFYLGIRNGVDKKYRWFAWIIFCFMCYNFSLNIMREAMAVSVIFYLYSDFNKITLKRVIGYSIFATLLHTSGLLSFAFYFYYWFLEKKFKHRFQMEIWLFLFTIFITFTFDKILTLIIGNGLLSMKFVHYTTSEYNFYILNFILKVVALIGFCLCYYKQLRIKPNFAANDMLFGFALMDLFTTLYSNLLLERIAYYFCVFEIIYIPISLHVFSTKMWNRKVYIGILLITIVLYWYINFVFFGYTETIPYKFGF